MYIDDRTRLLHMLEAAQEALLFVRGRSKKDLATDRQFALSLVKELEILGEAASKISGRTRKAHAGIPWMKIVSMRNRLIHAYHDINNEIVWSTVKRSLPPLIRRLQAALK